MERDMNYYEHFDQVVNHLDKALSYIELMQEPNLYSLGTLHYDVKRELQTVKANLERISGLDAEANG